MSFYEFEEALMQLLGGLKIIGHRGASAYEPENTMLAFKEALLMGAHWIECDVHLSQDDEWVVIHDKKVDRTTNGKGRVRNLKFEELKKLDAGKKQQIPSLVELLDWMQYRPQLVIAIEVKIYPKSKPELIQNLIHMISGKNLLHRTIIISFNPSFLKHLRKFSSEIYTGILMPRSFNYRSKKSLIQNALRLKVNSLWPSHHLLNLNFVKEAHQKNLAVFAWTINHSREMLRAIEMGVDGIETDMPDVLRELISYPSGLQERRFQ